MPVSEPDRSRCLPNGVCFFLFASSALFRALCTHGMAWDLCTRLSWLLTTKGGMQPGGASTSCLLQVRRNHGLRLGSLLGCLAKFWTYGVPTPGPLGPAWPLGCAPARQPHASAAQAASTAQVDAQQEGDGSEARGSSASTSGRALGSGSSPDPSHRGAYLPPHLRRRTRTPAASPQRGVASAGALVSRVRWYRKCGICLVLLQNCTVRKVTSVRAPVAILEVFTT